MKILKFIKNLFIGILAVIFFAFVIAITMVLLNVNKYGVAQFEDTSLIIIRKNISSGNYKKGDLVVVEEKKIDEVKVGDELFTYKVDGDGNVSIDLGIVGEVHDQVDDTDDAVTFENGSTYAISFVAGESTKVYNNIGTYLGILQSRWGFLFIVLVPCFLIFIYELYALIVEIKYGKEDELEEIVQVNA